MFSDTKCCIVFDLETTGLHYDAEIISIAACDLQTRSKFYNEIRPRNLPISKIVSELTGLTSQQLYRKPFWTTVGHAFWQWIEKLLKDTQKKELIFIGHNVRSFDIPRLLRESKRLLRDRPFFECEAVWGLDTLDVSRKKFSHLKSHRQASLFTHLFQKPPDMQHNAMGDVNALVTILDHLHNERDIDLKDVVYDLRSKHAKDLKQCAHLFKLSNMNSRDIRHFWKNTRNRDFAIQNLHCSRCDAIYSSIFQHSCAPSGT